MKNTRKKYAVLAVLMAASMLATGCGGDGAAEETSVSINVIGDGAYNDNGASLNQTEPKETVVVTDGEGNAVTGAGGNVITEAAGGTEAPSSETLSEEDILAAMTTPSEDKPQVNVSQNAGVR